MFVDIATGAKNEIEFLEYALKNMFFAEFSTNIYSDASAELRARLYTEDAESEKRKPHLISAASDLKKRYGLVFCEINDKEKGYVKPEKTQIERYETIDKAIEASSLDVIHRKNFGLFGKVVSSGVYMPNRQSFKSQFIFLYGKEPTELQLDTFIKFMIGEETDIDKVQKICNGEDFDGSGNQPNK